MCVYYARANYLKWEKTVKTAQAKVVKELWGFF